MKVKCVWEHNGNDTLLYSVNYIGAYTRGESLDVAIAKMPGEVVSYLKWLDLDISESIEVIIVGEKNSDLNIKDADSDVLFEDEKNSLTTEEYQKLKALALKSAKDFLVLYESIPDKKATAIPERKTFYGNVPRSADEMYEHTKNVNEYYFAETQITVVTFTNADCVDWRFWRLSPIISKMRLLKVVMERNGRSERFFAVLFGTTVFTQELCIEWH